MSVDNWGSGTLPQHREKLESSAITAATARLRGTRSVEEKAALARLGYPSGQRMVPGLLFPLHDAWGRPAGFQYRPDRPREKKGRIVKYESPPGQKNMLDVPPAARPDLADPSITLWITEGPLKADAAVTAGLCCVALLGVWGWRGTNEMGGKTMLPDFEAVALNGRDVIIAFDSDASSNLKVHKAMVRLSDALSSRGAIVRFLHLPSLRGGKCGLDDALAAGYSTTDLHALVDGELGPFDIAARSVLGDGTCRRCEGDGDGHDEVVVAQRPLDLISTDVLTRLVEANDPPRLFVRGGCLARVRTDEAKRPLIEEVGIKELRYLIARTMHPVVRTRGGALCDVACPLDVVSDIVAHPQLPFPALLGVVETPTLRAGGTVHDHPGYDPTTRLIYAPNTGLTIPPVAESPSREDISGAVAVILELLEDFPFDSDADRANAIGLLLTPTIRPAFDACVPLALIDSPEPGTGKGLLANVINVVATGRAAAARPLSRNEEEIRKMITATLHEGPALVVLDNIEGALRSPTLAAVLTTLRWSDRRLGSSDTTTSDNRAAWLATGNNIKVGGDLARRCYMIRLDTGKAKPHQRDSFRHPNLLEWARDCRGMLIHALLTIARAWHEAGRPPAPTTPAFGGFTEWSALCAGILHHAGIGGFLSNLTVLHSDVDAEAAEWEAFLCTVQAVYGGDLTAGQLASQLRDGNHAIRDSVPGALAPHLNASDLAARIGMEFANRTGRHYGDDEYCVQRVGTNRQKAAVWRVDSI